MVAKSIWGQSIERLAGEYRSLDDRLRGDGSVRRLLKGHELKGELPEDVADMLVEYRMAVSGLYEMGIPVDRSLVDLLERSSRNNGCSFNLAKSRYDLIRDGTYGQVMGVLRKDYAAGRIPNHPTYQMPGGAKAVRALTMKDTALARMNNYETLKDANGSARSDKERLALFKTWSFTSSGIAYQKKSAKCKILPVSENLVTIFEDYNQEYIPIEYSKIKGAEIDTSTGKYNQYLTLYEALENAGWIESFEQDKKALSDYANLAFKLLNNQGRAMVFWTIQNPSKDHLRALALGCLDYGSRACGHLSLSHDARFVRVNPS